MAVRRSYSVCWSCQSRQSFTSRNLSNTARSPVELALRPEDDGFIFDSNSKSEGHQLPPQDEGPVLPLQDSMRQCNLLSPIDELRETLLGFEALYARRDLRLSVLRNLSNPWPELSEQNHQRSNSSFSLRSNPKPSPHQLPESTAFPTPHPVFRQNLKSAIGAKPIRSILRAQLLRCEHPKEMLRVVAVAMQTPTTAANLAALPEPLMRALYRSRKNVSDPEVLSTLNAIVSRFRMAGLEVRQQLLHMGLKFSARARTLQGMKRYLQMYRERGLPMSSHTFRSVIAKFSIGHRGLGEIRNGRWRRDELLQVLNGSEDAAHLQPEHQYHLGTWLVREDWQYLHGWIAVLARCKDSRTIWKEWQMWKQSEARTRPKMLGGMKAGMTSRVRGDYWFVEQMAYAGDLEKAWAMLAETGIEFANLKWRVKTRLLEAIEYATVWDERVREEMVRKWDVELAKIERALGIVWLSDTDGGGADISEGGAHGKHVMIEGVEQETVLDGLGSDDWKAEEEAGFPYESLDGAVREDGPTSAELEERELHCAEEEGLAVEGDWRGV